MRVIAVAAAIAAIAVPPGQAQSGGDGGQFMGPRVGVTFLSDGVRQSLRDEGIPDPTVMLQFGWQWEQRFEIGPEAPLPMTQFVLLVGGAEQGLFLPSLSWLIGFRGRDGFELGLGPNLSLAGASLVIAAGVTNRAGNVNIPWNIAIVPGAPGLRVSLLTGFNMSSRRLEAP